jgi:hypothetical protein
MVSTLSLCPPYDVRAVIAMNDEESLLLRQNSSTGKSAKNLSSPSRKNIPLNLSGKSAA